MADLSELINEVAAANNPVENVEQVATPTSEAPATETTIAETPEKVEAPTTETELTEVVETPASTEEAAKTESQKPTEEVAVTKSFEEQLRELGFTSADEAKATKEKLKQLEERNTLGTLLDKLTAQGVDAETVIRYQKLDLTAKNGDGTPKVSDRHVLELQLQLKHPSLTSEQRNAMLDEEYGSQNTEDANFGTPAQQGRQTIAATKAREELMAEKAKVLDVKQASESFETIKAKDFEVKETARVKEWESNSKVKEIASSIATIGKKISFGVFGEDNKPVSKNFNFTHRVDQNDVVAVEESLRVAAINEGLDPADPKSFEYLKGMGENIYKLQKFDKIIDDVVRQNTSYWHKYIATTYHGAKPTGLTPNQGASGGDKQTERIEASMARM